MKQRLRQFHGDKSLAEWYRQWKTHTVNPNLRINFFEAIDTKEKAYWLGFLYADGYMIGNTSRAEIRLKLSLGDEDTIDRFCKCLKLNKDNKEYLTDEGGRKQVMIRFRCKKMSSDLVRHGLKFRKSRIIEYPKLHNRRLELAFLLGYYDGDGRRGTTRIFSGSLQFLKQVKNRFKLPYKIGTDRREKRIYGREIRGTTYSMHLGATLFNEMMKCYQNSITRERWFPCEGEETLRRTLEASMPKNFQRRIVLQREWRSTTKEKLEELVWKMPLKGIADRFNVSNSDTVTRKCREYGITLPPRGYWTRVYWTRVYWTKIRRFRRIRKLKQ